MLSRRRKWHLLPRCRTSLLCGCPAGSATNLFILCNACFPDRNDTLSSQVIAVDCNVSALDAYQQLPAEGVTQESGAADEAGLRFRVPEALAVWVP